LKVLSLIFLLLVLRFSRTLHVIQTFTQHDFRKVIKLLIFPLKALELADGVAHVVDSLLSK
jgi:hypothetical protein